VLLASGPVQDLGVPAPRLSFGDDPTGRKLLVDGRAAFDLPYWCGTCPYFFQRLDGADRTLSMDALTDRLNDGLDGVDEEVVRAFSAILPEGRYLPLLLTVDPRLTREGWPGDFFTGENAAIWGEFAPLVLARGASTPYYRTFDSRREQGGGFHEFVVPLVEPAWNAMPTVVAHAERLRTSPAPTAVAVATLDTVRPWANEETAENEHWYLTHFLLDGHHKMQAAALTGRALRLLSLVTLDESPAGEEAVLELPEVRRPRISPAGW
jgi:hypothetical protein